MKTQKAQYEKKGWTFDQAKMEEMFSNIDANGDGVASADEKKAYWAARNQSRSNSNQNQNNSTSAPSGQRTSQATATPLSEDDVDPSTPTDVQPHEGTGLEGYTIAFSDEFNGNQIDESKWEYRLDSKHWSTQLAENNSVANGVCSIHLKKEKAGGKDYTGGGIITRKYFGYGYYEARIKCPAGPGWHTSFWMMDNHHVKSDSSQIELDPLETDSNNLHQYSTDYHQWRSDIGHLKRYQLVKTPNAPLNEFHVYGMEWTPEGADFYLDGKLVRTASDLTQQLTKEEKAAGEKPIVRKISDTDKNAVQIWFTSLATWLGNTKEVDDSALPQTAECDYIRFFDSDASIAASQSMATKSKVGQSTTTRTKLAKGDVTLEMFLATQKAQQEKKGNDWNPAKYKKMFEQIDTNGDGIASGDEKKAYWSK